MNRINIYPIIASIMILSLVGSICYAIEQTVLYGDLPDKVKAIDRDIGDNLREIFEENKTGVERTIVFNDGKV